MVRTAFLFNHVCECLYCALTSEYHASIAFPGMCIFSCIFCAGSLVTECAGCEELADFVEVGGMETVFEDGDEDWGVIVCGEVIFIAVIWRGFRF